VRRWYARLGRADAERVDGAIRALRRAGPGLGRHFADSVKGSRHHNMKELRAGRSIRILFAFDPQRRAVLLVGGDKRGDWQGWYPRNIRLADRLYDEHLRRLGKGVRWQRSPVRAASPSAGRGR
jgi:hypothetical protein